jgi:sugar lactone lactonase YvrE
MLAGLIMLALAGMAAATDIPMPTHEVTVKAGDTYDGIQYPVGTKVNLYDKGNTVGSVVLSQDFKMNGQLILKGTQLYVPHGKLGCLFSREGQTIGAIVLKKDAQVCFNEQARLEMIHLAHDNDILGYPFAANSWVQFHPGGKVAQGELARGVTRDGVALAGRSEISFYPSGAIDSAAVAPGATFKTFTLGKRQHDNADVRFWPNGKLKEAQLLLPVPVGGVSCAPGPISFEESGALKYCEVLKTGAQLAADVAQQALSALAQANVVQGALKAPGTVSLIAGSLEIEPVPAGAANRLASADGMGAAARFDRPIALAADRAGNLFLTESGTNNAVRKISTSGMVTTIAGMAGAKGHGYRDGAASSARFADPAGIAIDTKGNLYVADTGNHAIRKISITGVVSTFAGKAPQASLKFPTGLAIDRAGNLHVTTIDGSVLHKIDRNGAMTTYAGNDGAGYRDGGLDAARFTSIDKMAFDDAGNLFLSDMKLLRKITPSGTVSTLGNYADSSSPVTYAPDVLLVDPNGNLYFAVNSTIRKLTPAGALSTVAGVAGHKGNQTGVTGVLTHPRGMVMLGPKTFAFISGNTVLRLVLP